MSTTLDVSLKVLYVQGLAVEVDRTTTDQLRKASAELQITTIAGSAAALAELRRTPGWQALFASPSLPQNEVLALIASLRRDRIPIAIVPILDDAHQDLFAAAVASGADDVLVRRNGTLVNIKETLTRIRQSPHLFPAEQRRRISVLYAGRDPLVWNLLDQVPFVKADRVATGVDGTCSVRRPGAGDDSLRADAVIIDEAPGDAHPLQVLKSVKAQASDLPVVMLTSAGAADIATAALELGADDTVLKTGIFRRRLIATLRRVHQRLELSAQQNETRTREERLRQIVENVPTGIMVVAGDGRILAMNAAALRLFGASKPRDLVGRDFRDMTDADARQAVTDLIHQVTKGEPGSLTFPARSLTGEHVEAHIDAVVLERDARGGRGLVASIRQHTTAPADAPDGTTSAELTTLRDALQTLERHYAELEDARTSERAAWESERQRLEGRLEEAERLAAERGQLEARLAEVSAELSRANEAFAEERRSLEVRLEELEDAARRASEAGAAHAELEQALEAVREEQRQAIAAHALERSGWQDIRTELESRVQQLDELHQSEHDTLVASLQQDVQRLEQTLSDERSRWQTTREQLEGELKNAREALWAEHSERDAARATFESELESLRATLEQDRSAAAEQRLALEGERDQARAQAENAEAALNDAKTSMEQGRLEAEETLATERRNWSATQGALEDARRQLEETLAAERRTWQEQQTALEEERRQLLDRGVQQGDLAAERARIETELDAARKQWHAERSAVERELAELREQVDRAEHSAQVLADQHEDSRSLLERERDDAQTRLADAERELRERGTRLDDELREAREQADAAVRDLDTAQQRWVSEKAALEEELERRLREDQERVDGIEATLAEAKSGLSRLETEWQQERGQLVSLHTQEAEQWRQAVDQARSERDQAIERLGSLEADLDGTRHQIDELDALRHDRDAARGDLDQAHQRVAALEADLDGARQQIAELDGLRHDRDAARGDLDQARQRVATLEADLGDAHQRLAELDGLRHDLDTARGDLDSARQRVAALEADLGEAHQRLAELDGVRHDRDAARGDLDQARQRVAALEADLGDSRQQLAELDGVRHDRDAARGDLDHARQRVAALEADLDGARQQLAELDGVRHDLDTARGDLDQARQRVAALEADLGDARQQLDGFATLEADLDRERGERAQAEARASALRGDLDEARRVAETHRTAVDALEAARSEIRHTDATHRAERDAWHERRQALEHDLRDAEARYRADREAWEQGRAALEADARDAAALAREQQYLKDAITSLQAECAELTATIVDERAGHDRARRQVESLRQELAESAARLADVDAELERAARSADEQLARREARYDARERELEEEIRRIADRLAAQTREAENTRAALQDDYARASTSLKRLVTSDAFGYAVTTRNGQLVECNQAFATMFGYADEADALARSAGRPFPGLSNRPEIDSRLAANGRIDRVTSCVERVDGRAVRIIETATLITSDDGRTDNRLIEHIIVAGPVGPTSAEVQARRLQEVGALASAMMPEVESLAASVEAGTRELPRPGESRRSPVDVDGLREASARVATLARQLAAFSRRQVRETEPLDLGETVRAAEPVLARLLGDYVGFSTDLHDTTPISAQPEDLDHLLTSLVTLGRDLLPAGGALLLQVRQEETGSLSPDSLGVPGPVLAIRATGYGVRLPGTLTALELAAQRCGGTVHVHSDAGRQALVEVVFPRCGMPMTAGWSVLDR